MLRTTRNLFILTALGASSGAAQRLSSDEQKVVAAVDASQTDALALLERLVNINSGSLNVAGVKLVGDKLSEEFVKLGFTTRWVDGAAWQRAGHLIATWRGN